MGEVVFSAVDAVTVAEEGRKAVLVRWEIKSLISGGITRSPILNRPILFASLYWEKTLETKASKTADTTRPDKTTKTIDFLSPALDMN